MESDRLASLERRLSDAEAALAAAETRIEHLEAYRGESEARRAELIQRARSRLSEPAVETSDTTEPAAASASWRNLVDAVTGEGAIGRIGSVLMVLGALYGVQYGIDRGWIVPWVRVAGIAFLGVVLLVLSLRLAKKRPLLAGLLSGAGIASLYVSVFAAQALYALIPFALGLGLTTAVTVLCLGLADWRKDAAIAILAALGGLATPFILQSESASVPGLVAYLVAVMIGVGALYVRHGWRSLIVFAAAIGLPVAVVVVTVLRDLDPAGLADQWAAQVGLLVGLAAFAWLPIFRTTPGKAVPMVPKWLNPEAARAAVGSLAGVTLFTVWMLEHLVWDLESTTWGLIGLGAIAVVQWWYERLWATGHLDGAISLRWGQAAVALFVVLELADDYEGLQIAVVSALALLLLFDSERREARHPALIALGLWTISIFWFVARIVENGPSGMPFLSVDALGDTAALACFGFGVHRVSDRSLRTAGFWTALVGLIALAGREFTNPGALTAAWAVIALSLLVAGYHWHAYQVRLAGLGVLALVVGKLLLVDMASSDPLVRVLLFLGIGGILMLMSYMFPSLWKSDVGADTASKDT